MSNSEQSKGSGKRLRDGREAAADVSTPIDVTEFDKNAPTPRTDAFQLEENKKVKFPGLLFGMVDHARQLERELAESRRNADDWMQRYGSTQGHSASEKCVANQSASHERQGVDRAGCYRQALRLSVGTVLSEYAANKIIHLAEDLAKLAEDELPPASAKPIAVNGEYTGTRRNT